MTGPRPGDPGERKAMVLRLDPAVHAALSRWAGDDLRSVNAQIEWLIREALRRAGRLPAGLREPRKPGRPARGPDLVGRSPEGGPG